jgi:hypothetical protein
MAIYLQAKPASRRAESCAAGILLQFADVMRAGNVALGSVGEEGWSDAEVIRRKGQAGF